jgi:hypothetical protein
MNESKDFIWAEYASGWTDYVDSYYKHVGTRIFNLQLRYWVEAQMKFQNLYDENYKVEELLIILNLLCCSLETLAGVNIKPPKKDFAPALIWMYKNTLKSDKGWDLENERPDLFKNLEDMDNYHKRLCKHIHISDSRRDLLKQVNYDNIRRYMNTTRDIWLWILNKKFKGNVPKDQLVFFSNE